MKQMEEQGGTKKKSRKYSFLEEKLKEEEFIHMISKSANIVMKYIRYHTFSMRRELREVKERQSIVESPYLSRRNSRVSNRSSSQASILGMMKESTPELSICKDVWTPVFIQIQPNYQSTGYALELLLETMVVGMSEGE